MAVVEFDKMKNATLTQIRRESQTTDNEVLDPYSSFTKYMHEHPNAKCVVGINGGWYDVTSFRFRHPGGHIILEQCHGKDASDVFKAFHERNVLKGWRPVATYNREDICNDIATQAFSALHDEFLSKGYFKTSLWWYIGKFAVSFIILFGCILLLTYYRLNASVFSTMVSALLLGLFWQQCGFFMHDFMHNELTHQRKFDRWFGMLFGSFLLGISAHWWRDEHFEHHAFTNVIDDKTLYIDPQMQEEVWAQSPKLFPLYRNRGHYVLDWCQTQLLHYQHILWIPICVIGGRIAIVVNGVFKERRWYEVIALTLHTLCVFSMLYYYLPTWKLRILFYITAGIYEGILHVQLLISHYAKPWIYMCDLFTTTSWYRSQVLCNINIKNPVWLDWFHGGLNFHIEHHLYPMMPRNRFREASIRVKQVCKEIGLPYDECFWFEGIIRTLQHLRNVANMYSGNPFAVFTNLNSSESVQ